MNLELFKTKPYLLRILIRYFFFLSERKILMNFLSTWGGLWTCISCQETSKSRICITFIYNLIYKIKQIYKLFILCLNFHCVWSYWLHHHGLHVHRVGREDLMWSGNAEWKVIISKCSIWWQVLQLVSQQLCELNVIAQFLSILYCFVFFFFSSSKLKTKMYLALQSLELDLSKMAGMYW